MYFRTLIPNNPHDIELKYSPGEILAKYCIDHVIWPLNTIYTFAVMQDLSIVEFN